MNVTTIFSNITEARIFYLFLGCGPQYKRWFHYTIFETQKREKIKTILSNFWSVLSQCPADKAILFAQLLFKIYIFFYRYVFQRGKNLVFYSLNFWTGIFRWFALAILTSIFPSNAENCLNSIWINNQLNWYTVDCKWKKQSDGRTRHTGMEYTMFDDEKITSMAEPPDMRNTTVFALARRKNTPALITLLFSPSTMTTRNTAKHNVCAAPFRVFNQYYWCVNRVYAVQCCYRRCWLLLTPLLPPLPLVLLLRLLLLFIIARWSRRLSLFLIKMCR